MNIHLGQGDLGSLRPHRVFHLGPVKFQWAAWLWYSYLLIAILIGESVLYLFLCFAHQGCPRFLECALFLPKARLWIDLCQVGFDLHGGVWVEGTQCGTRGQIRSLDDENDEISRMISRFTCCWSCFMLWIDTWSRCRRHCSMLIPNVFKIISPMFDGVPQRCKYH